MLHVVAATEGGLASTRVAMTANLTDRECASTVPIASRKEPAETPTISVALVQRALVQPKLSGVPELDARRDHATAGPVRRARHGLVRIKFFNLRHPAEQLGPARKRFALERGPRADLALARARRK